MIAMNSSPRYRNTPVGPPSGWREPARFGANDDPRNDDFGTFTSCMLKYVSTSEQSMYCPSPVRSRCSRAKPMDIAAVTPVAWSPIAVANCAGPRHHAGGKVLNQHIDLRYDRPDELTAARLLNIDGQAFFRVIVLEKIRALRARLEFGIARLVARGAAAVAVWRQLQLDDLGAQLRQYPRASRARDDLGNVEHAIAREHRQFGTHRLLAALIRKEILNA